MKITVNDCYELEGDYQNQFLGIEVFPKPKYKKLKKAERRFVILINIYSMMPSK